jgi:hypothetical protein
MLQSEAFQLLTMGKNVFLTGAAGAGKTYVLNQYINYLKKNQVEVAITASTGIAATHLQGTTIHSWSGIGIKETLTAQDFKKLDTNKRVKKNFRIVKVLIIDEISMLHRYQLDLVDAVSRHFLDSSKPFGGLQVVLCGDFFQLPPVSTASIEVEKHFAFQASAWEQADFHVCYLHEQHRQGSDPLITVLNNIRSGTAGEHTKVPLRTRYKKEPEGSTKATKLYARNVNVDAINASELAKLPTEEKTFTMQTKGFRALIEGLKKSCLAPEHLILKKGAEVMFIKNDPQGKYVNGTRGVVLNFDGDEGWPIVRTYDNKIICACPEDWTYEEHHIIRAKITQVPLRLAWAITIHKSQGMTLDAAEMDLGDTFEPGMGYVALSRLRSLSGLKIMNLNEMALQVHPLILQYDQVLKENSEKAGNYLNALPEKEREEIQKTTLFNRFEAKNSIPEHSNSGKSKKPETVPGYVITQNHLKENFTLESLAESRELTVGTITRHIEKLQQLKLLTDDQRDHLKRLIPQDAFELLYEAFSNSQDGKLKPIYDAFEGKYSYSLIQLVRMFVINDQ